MTDEPIPRLLHIMREAPLGAVERAEAGDMVAKLGDPGIELTGIVRWI